MSPRKIVDTSKTVRKIDPDEVAKALGAEPVSKPSKAVLQMSVMDLEFEGPMQSFDALCKALAEKHKTTSDYVRGVIVKENIRTKTPRGSAIKQPWDEPEEDVQDIAEQLAADIPVRDNPPPEPPKELPKLPKKADPVPPLSRSGISVPEGPLDKCPYSDRYKVLWMKCFEQGKADKAAGTPKNYNVIPKSLPEHERYADYEATEPLFSFKSAYDQGYEGRTSDFVHVGLWLPSEKARGMTRQVLWEKSMTERGLTEIY